MKILHTSDLHLDSALTSRLDSGKVRERKNELLLSFKRLSDTAQRANADAIIIAGDLFDSERVGKRTLKNAVEIIAASRNISFFYLPGNHERDVLSKSGLALPDNLFIFGRNWTRFTLNGVNFIGRSETERDMFDALQISENQKNIIVLHGELRDKSDSDGVIGRREIEGLPIDYIALGHYHSYSETKIGSRTAAVYCGTPEPRGFDEAFDCGYVEINITEHYAEHKFKSFAKRRFHIIDVDVSDAESEVEAVYRVERAVSGIPKSDLLRIRLTGERELGKRFNTETVLSFIRAGFYYAEVKDETCVRISPDAFKNDVSLKGEFIRGVLADTDLTAAEKDAIINLGLEVLLTNER